MNELNVGSREACQRLYDAGIALRTSAYWHINPKGEHELLYDVFAGHLVCSEKCRLIPAPSMVEVWRELPKGCKLKKYSDSNTVFDPSEEHAFDSINPTDALIELRIWLEKENKERG